MRLSFKISLLASIVSIFFILVVFTNTQQRIITESKQHIIEDYKRNLQQLQNSFDLILQKSTETISLLAMMRNDVVTKNNPTMQKKFEMSMRDISSITKLTLLSLEGKELIVASKKRLLIKANSNISYKNSPLFQNALKNNIYISDIYFDTNSNEMILDISKVVKNPKTQKNIAVLLLQVSLEEMKESITNKLINGNGIALINLNNDQFIYKSSEVNNIIQDNFLEIFANNKNVQFINANYDDYLVVSKEYNFNNIQIKFVILNNTQNIFSHINHTFNINTLFLFIAIILLAGITFFFISYSLKPLSKLIKDIQNLSKEISLDEKPPYTKGLDEITSIKQHFEFFIKLITKERDKLKHHNETLEIKIAEEISKNQEQERALAHQTKMAALGEMIGNIAHQWRQPLSIISTIASGIKVKKEYGSFDEDEVIKNMDTIVDQSNYLSKTIDDFRDFIKDKGTKTQFSTTKMLSKVLSLVNSSLKNNHIEIETNFEYDITINGYENELVQAFINILNNSKDAIKTLDQVDSKKMIFITTKQVEKGIEISILDTGGGIDEDIISRVFEPYFTTKHQSIGTGIGLSMVDQIIRERSDGTISLSNKEFKIENKPYKGALFKITFPSVL